jgi:hypothetical protein
MAKTSKMSDEQLLTSLKAKPYALTDEHFRVFGAIVQWFASFEKLIEINIHQISGGEAFGLTSLLMSQLGYKAKVDTLNSLLGMVRIGGDEKYNTAMKVIIADFNKYSSLRNAIAHNTWTRGRPKDFVKPVYISTRSGKAKIVGVHMNEKAYKIRELRVIEKALKDHHDALAHLVLGIASRKLENKKRSTG